MSKRFYIATRKDREIQANTIADALQSRGWERTFVWTSQDGSDAAQHADVAKRELDAIKNADVLVVLLPGGYGTHVEIGAALALGKLVILHAPDRRILNTPYPCIFHYHPAVKLIISANVDLDAILSAVEE